MNVCPTCGTQQPGCIRCTTWLSLPDPKRMESILPRVMCDECLRELGITPGEDVSEELFAKYRATLREVYGPSYGRIQREKNPVREFQDMFGVAVDAEGNVVATPKKDPQ